MYRVGSLYHQVKVNKFKCVLGAGGVGLGDPQVNKFEQIPTVVTWGSPLRCYRQDWKHYLPHSIVGGKNWNIQCANMSSKSVVFWADVGTSETRQLYDIGNLAAEVDSVGRIFFHLILLQPIFSLHISYFVVTNANCISCIAVSFVFSVYSLSLVAQRAILFV